MQVMSGNLDATTQAAGRLFCMIDDTTGDYHIVWTQNQGNLLATVVGDDHEAVQRWWFRVHHNINISVGGSTPTPMDMGGTPTDMSQSPMVMNH
jgi:hypothetical protein